MFFWYNFLYGFALLPAQESSCQGAGKKPPSMKRMRLFHGFRPDRPCPVTGKNRNELFKKSLAPGLLRTWQPSSFCRSRFCFWAAHPEARPVFFVPALRVEKISPRIPAVSPSQEIGHFPAHHILGNLPHAPWIATGYPPGSRTRATGKLQADGPQPQRPPLLRRHRPKHGQARHAQHARQVHRPTVIAHHQTGAQKQPL